MLRVAYNHSLQFQGKDERNDQTADNTLKRKGGNYLDAKRGTARVSNQTINQSVS